MFVALIIDTIPNRVLKAGASSKIRILRRAI
jgi:hypothetical protein